MLPAGRRPAFDLLLHCLGYIDGPPEGVLELLQLPGVRVDGRGWTVRRWTVHGVRVDGRRWTVILGSLREPLLQCFEAGQHRLEGGGEGGRRRVDGGP
jgi:hypothetical protein